MKRPNPADVERYTAIYTTLRNVRALLRVAHEELMYTTQPSEKMRTAIQTASTTLQGVQLECTRITDPEHAPLLEQPETRRHAHV